jgi:DNA-binding NarL/FixJ family response regulator
MFRRRDPELEVVGEEADGIEGVERLRQLRTDVVVMDGISATSIICSELPESEVIDLSSVLESSAVVGAIRTGAIGYLFKDAHRSRAPYITLAWSIV